MCGTHDYLDALIAFPQLIANSSTTLYIVYTLVSYALALHLMLIH